MVGVTVRLAAVGACCIAHGDTINGCVLFAEGLDHIQAHTQNLGKMFVSPIMYSPLPIASFNSVQRERLGLQ